ncbi:hypothetical protein [Magnetococcus sp. PR-3]|uniref:hypothetical protein n=1 Tax=Magnetococcus sp. PR-3 TaxID=3120355 RepID=UPI002FCE5F85
MRYIWILLGALLALWGRAEAVEPAIDSDDAATAKVASNGLWALVAGSVVIFWIWKRS